MTTYLYQDDDGNTVAEYQPTDRVGRYVQNAFGMQEYIVMEARYWACLDWLEERNDLPEMSRRTQLCDEMRQGKEFGKVMQDFIEIELRARKEGGAPYPEWLDYAADMKI